MPVSPKDAHATVYRISMDDSLKDILIEIERVFDSNHLFAYRNWMQGVVCEGPEVSRHWVSVAFRWPADSKPDMAGAERLEKLNVMHKSYEDVMEVQRESFKAEDIDPETDEPVIDKVPVFYVEFEIPRKFVANVKPPVNTGVLPTHDPDETAGAEPETDNLDDEDIGGDF